ncbi:hypothetical protein JCM12296A_17520 [Desulfosarcina cetonica]
MKRFLKWLILPTLVVLVGVGVHWTEHAAPTDTMPSPLAKPPLSDTTRDPAEPSTAAQFLVEKEHLYDCTGMDANPSPLFGPLGTALPMENDLFRALPPSSADRGTHNRCAPQ